MKCVPTASVAVDSDAVPPLRATVPSNTAPSRNCTVPVGPDNGLTVAVKVTSCPKTEGSRDDVNAVAVAVITAFTVCIRVEDVLPVKLASPA
jgi:hypothetical protein